MTNENYGLREICRCVRHRLQLLPTRKCGGGAVRDTSGSH